MPRLVVELTEAQMVMVKRVCEKQNKTASDIAKAAFGLKPAKRGRPPAKKIAKKK